MIEEPSSAMFGVIFIWCFIVLAIGFIAFVIKVRLPKGKKTLFKSRSEEESFFKWAFGDDYMEQPICQRWMAWNNLHKDLLWTHCNCCLITDLEKIHKYWKQESGQ